MVEKKTATRKKKRGKTTTGKSGTSGSGKTAAKRRNKPEKGGKTAGSDNDRKHDGRIILDESLTISTADNFRDQLAGYSGEYRTIEIDGSKIELIDTAALQILTSFIMQSSRESVEIRWVGKSEVLVKTATLLGLTGHLNM